MAKLFQIIFILFFLIVFLCLAPISAVKIENVTLFGEKIQLEPNTWSIIPCHFIPRSPIKNNKISLEWDKEESGAYIPVIQLAGIKMRTVSLRDNRFKVFKDLVHKGNCSLIIDSTKLTDSGSYQLRLTVGGKLFKPFPRIQVQIEETKKFKQGTWHVPHRHLGTKNRKIPISDNRKLSAELDSEASDEKNEEKPSRTEAKWSTGLIAGVASACCVVVLITVITCVVYCYRKKRKEEVQAQDEESLSNLNEVETKEVEVPEPQGFPNLGNTCYMNATLQCLHSVQPFVSDLLKQKIPKKTTQFAFIRNLSSLLERKDTCSVKKRTALLLKLKDSLSDSAERFAENNQHDAHDFLSECFNLIKENIENLSRISKNPITCPVKSNFEFEMENIYTCKKCGKTRTSVEKTNYLYVNLIQEESDSDSTWDSESVSDSVLMTIQDAVDNNFLEETVELSCEKCGGNNSTLKKTFRSLPRILIVQLKRFWFDYETLETEKLYEEVEVSLSLTVSPYCTERTSLPLPRPEMDSNVKEKKTKISRKAMKKSTKEDKFQSYNLVSIVNHIGDGAEDGHYVSDVYDDKTKTWLTYDDSDVNEMDPEAMLATRAYTGYLYFYIHKSFLNVK